MMQNRKMPSVVTYKLPPVLAFVVFCSVAVCEVFMMGQIY